VAFPIRFSNQEETAKMSRNLSHKGKGLHTDPAGLPVDDDLSEVPLPRKDKKTSSRPSFSTPSQRRTDQAIDDAQSSLDSLLKGPTDGHPSGKSSQIISQSGRVLNQGHGRIAAPASLTSGKTPGSTAPRPTYYLGSGPDDEIGEDSDKALAIVPGTVPLYKEVETRAPDTALARGVALATSTLQTAKERAALLVSDGTPGALGLPADAEELHTSRRAAAQWATRYATHMVVLAVVAVLVALGGLKALTTQGAYNHDIQSSESLGTDHFDGDDAFAMPGQQTADSSDFNVTLPRTELGGTDAAKNSGVKPAVTKSQPAPGQPNNATYNVAQYTVVEGDTIEGIAKKFNVMPETVMGSNGIWDSEEVLAPGRTLMVPPIDGMYYVPQAGDTLQGVADYFQADPDAITQYPGNKLDNGQLIAGQPIVVPAGMMPQREEAVTYTVRQGDTLKRIAARFGIDVPTIIDANDIPDPDNVQIGTELRLLPIPGVEYTVGKGDTVISIANKLGTTPQMILDYPPNNLTADSVLQVGATIMVPGGSPETVVADNHVEPASRGASQPAQRPNAQPAPPKTGSGSGSSNSGNSGSSSSAGKPQSSGSANTPAAPKPAPKVAPKTNKSSGSSSGSSSSGNSYKSGTGSLIWPVNGTITQYFSSHHNGLDIAISAGTPIHAADSGKVMWAGWRTDGLGYCVIIDHLDGYSTVYGHMIRQPSVYVGQYVSRGQVIGYVGSTGHSTGPHVHFMVKAGSATSHNYRNPLGFLGR
jgi:murein DD-endopeptidase MepM/ murein hydrolase activator NlpD